MITSRRSGLSYLAVPSTHQRVADLFKGSHWTGKANTAGGWVESLTRLEGVSANRTSKIDGRPTRCLWVPVDLILANGVNVAEDAADDAGKGPDPDQADF